MPPLPIRAEVLYGWSSLEAAHADEQVVLELSVAPVLEELEVVGVAGRVEGGAEGGAGGDGRGVVEALRGQVEAVALPRPEVLHR